MSCPNCYCSECIYERAWRKAEMCDRRVKQENKTKIERLIEAIEKLSHKMDQAQWSAPSAPADKLKAQIDRLEKLIG